MRQIAVRAVGNSAYISTRHAALWLWGRQPYNTLELLTPGKETMLSPFLSVPHLCEETADRLQRRLLPDGFRALQTFDLHDARLALDDCPCPHHGTAECDCQMVVVLIYGTTPEPATLILHGHDGQTWISLAEQPGQRTDASLLKAVERALDSDGPTGTAV